MNATMSPPVVLEHSSGLTIIYQHNPVVPVVAMQMWVKVGSGDESEREAGLAHVHEHMLFKGTGRRAVGEIARDVESVGGSINAWTSFDQTVYHVVMPARYAHNGLDILFDAITDSAFDADELERELEVIQEEIRRGQDMPTRVLSQSLFSTAFEVHPYGRPVIGTSESVDSFTRDDILAFYRRWYRPSNVTLVVVGDIERRDLMELVDEYAAGFPTTEPVVRNERPQEPAQTSFRSTVHYRDIQDGHISLAFHVPDLAHEDTPALELLTILLGQGDSSLLFEHVQRRDQLVNNVYAYLYAPAEPGIAMVGASFSGVENAQDPLVVLDALLDEVGSVAQGVIADADVARALRMLESDEIYQQQTVQGIAQRLGYFHTVAGGIEFQERFLELARQVTADDIARVAEEYFQPQNLTVGLMLPEHYEARNLRHEVLESRVRDMFAELETQHVIEAPEADAHGIVRMELDNGLTVIVQHDTSAPLVSIRSTVLAGSLGEDDETQGISAMVAELLTSGTSSQTASEIARSADELAASVSGFSGRNTVGLRITGLSRDFDDLMQLFVECLFESTFPEDEVERIRRETLAHIAAQRDNIAASTFRLFNEQVYIAHPYQRPINGTTESVSALTREQLAEFYHSAIRPERMVVTIVGDVDPAEALNSVATLFDRNVQGAPLVLPEREQSAPISNPVRVEDTRDRQQAHIVLGYPTCSMSHEDRMPLDILAAVLGGQGGRLFLELRDRQSLAYSVGAYSTTGYELGSFAFYIATSPNKIDQAIGGIRSEVARLRDEGITSDELERAQRYLIGRRAIALQRQNARAGYFGFDELYGFGHDYGFSYDARVEAVTLDDVQRAIDAYLQDQIEVLAIIRPDIGEQEAVLPPVE